MKFRWTDTISAAVEFEADNAAQMERVMKDALIAYRVAERRRFHGRLDMRLYIHIEVAPERWTDPIIGLDGYTKVYNDAGVQPTPPHEGPKMGRMYPILAVGPGAWHAAEVFAGGLAALGYWNGITGFISDVMDKLKKGEEGKMTYPNEKRWR